MHTRAHDPSKEPSKSAATPVPNQFQSRPFEVQAQPDSSSPQQQETPYSQEQQERAERYGYNFANVRVFAPQTPPGELPTSPSIQPKLTIKPVQTENSSLVDTSKPSHPFFERMYASNQQRQPQAAVGKVEPIVEYIRQSAIAEPQSSQNQSAQQQQETPDVQTQQQRTSHVGFNFANVAVHPNQSQEGKEDLPWRWLQPKLVVGQPGDKYEQEADLMAQRVMSMTQPANPQTIQRSSEGEDEVQRSPLAESITPLIQRSVTEEQDIQTQLWLQKADLGSKFQATAGLESRLAGERGGGSPLDEEVKGFMEPRFGNDFSSVRIHTGSNAVQMNQELQAQAFTHGSDVYFNEGKYNPGSNEGKQLLAHELTHVVQQTGAKKLQRKPLNSRLENKETRLAKERHQPPGAEEQEKELIQAKELPSRTPATTLNKELPPPQIEQEEEKELHQVKQISGRSSEFSPELTEAPPQAALAIASERTGSETKPQTEAGAKSAPKPQATTAAPTTVAAETDSVAPEAALKPASEPVVSESQASANSNIAVEKAPPQASPTPGMGAVPQTQSVTPSSSAAATQTAQAQSTTPPAQQEPEASADATSASQPAAAAPTMESNGGSAEESSAVETGGAAEETQIEAAAAEVPPGSAELDSSDKAAALASLAEGSGGGGASAGGGGGGGGVAIPDKPAPPAPDVSQAEPSAALAAVSNLPPAQLMAALGGVGSAVGNSVGKQRAELAANPPQMESPSGSPKTNKESAAERQVSKGKDLKAVEKTPEGQAKPVPQPKPLPLSSTPPAAAVPQPQVKGDAEGKLDSGDAQKLQASLRSLPTRDPGLQQVSAGAPPRLELEGNADPQQAQQQRAELEKGVTDAHVKGQQDLAQPMGENEIYPQVPQETLRAEGIGGGGGGAGGAAAQAAGGTAAAGGGAGGDDAVSIIAQQEHSQEIQAGVAQAQTAIAAKRQEHTTQVAEEKARSNQEIAKLQEENSAQQTAERAKAQTEVQQQRDAWKQEQDTLITKSRQDADAAVSKGNKDVQQEQTQAESKAAEHIHKGEEEAAAARQKGEEEAEKERQKGDKESGGIFGWLADKAKAFFDGIKQAIQKAFEVARAAVKAAIEGAQKLATAVIETARTAIVGIIKVVGQALMAIGDVLLAAFPEMRDRFRNAIKGVVKAAEAAVNALANTLKKGVQTALNLLGKGLDAALGLLEKGMKAAVDIAKAAVSGAIKLADAAIKAIGAFAVLIKDIAGNPGQWLSNLGAGAMDGIKNHFWGAFQTGVKEWFSQKVEEVLGLGMTVWNVLKQGGINTAEVGKMAWEGIKSAIPGVLIQILIEKVVSMIVPAAGTVMLIIEGLQAAWGTASRVFQAFDRFMVFLKAVKTGQAGPPFGSALAAAGVVLIDFVSNWLLKRLRGPASKIAGKIREIAAKIGKKLKKVFKKLKRKAGKLKDKFFGKKGGKGNKDRKHGHEKEQGKKNKDKDRENQEILKRAKNELGPKIETLLKSGVRGFRLRAQLLGWRVQYRLSRLYLEKSGKDSFRIVAKVNPQVDIADGVTLDAEELLLYIRQVAEEIHNHPDTTKHGQEILASQEIKEGSYNSKTGKKSQVAHYTVKQHHGLPGLVRASEQMEHRGVFSSERLNFEGSSAAQVARQQFWGKSTSNKLVYEVTPEGLKRSGADYESIAKDLTSMGPRKRVVSAIQTWMRTRTVPSGFDANKLAHLSTLMFGQEVQRNHASYITAAMTLDLAGKGGKSWEDALKMFPMSPDGAVEQNKQLNTHLEQWQQAKAQNSQLPTLSDDPQQNTSQQKDAKAAMAREIALIKAWLNTLDLKLDTLSDAEQKKEKIKEEIRQRMFKAYGLSPK